MLRRQVLLEMYRGGRHVSGAIGASSSSSRRYINDKDNYRDTTPPSRHDRSEDGGDRSNFRHRREDSHEDRDGRGPSTYRSYRERTHRSTKREDMDDVSVRRKDEEAVNRNTRLEDVDRRSDDDLRRSDHRHNRPEDSRSRYGEIHNEDVRYDRRDDGKDRYDERRQRGSNLRDVHHRGSSSGEGRRDNIRGHDRDTPRYRDEERRYRDRDELYVHRRPNRRDRSNTVDTRAQQPRPSSEYKVSTYRQEQEPRPVYSSSSTSKRQGDNFTRLPDRGEDPPHREDQPIDTVAISSAKSAHLSSGGNNITHRNEQTRLRQNSSPARPCSQSVSTGGLNRQSSGGADSGSGRRMEAHTPLPVVTTKDDRHSLTTDKASLRNKGRTPHLSFIDKLLLEAFPERRLLTVPRDERRQVPSSSDNIPPKEQRLWVVNPHDVNFTSTRWETAVLLAAAANQSRQQAVSSTTTGTVPNNQFLEALKRRDNGIVWAQEVPYVTPQHIAYFLNKITFPVKSWDVALGLLAAAQGLIANPLPPPPTADGSTKDKDGQVLHIKPARQVPNRPIYDFSIASTRVHKQVADDPLQTFIATLHPLAVARLIRHLTEAADMFLFSGGNRGGGGSPPISVWDTALHIYSAFIAVEEIVDRNEQLALSKKIGDDDATNRTKQLVRGRYDYRLLLPSNWHRAVFEQSVVTDRVMASVHDTIRSSVLTILLRQTQYQDSQRAKGLVDRTIAQLQPATWSLACKMLLNKLTSREIASTAGTGGLLSVLRARSKWEEGLTIVSVYEKLFAYHASTLLQFKNDPNLIPRHKRVFIASFDRLSPRRQYGEPYLLAVVAAMESIVAHTVHALILKLAVPGVVIARYHNLRQWVLDSIVNHIDDEVPMIFKRTLIEMTFYMAWADHVLLKKDDFGCTIEEATMGWLRMFVTNEIGLGADKEWHRGVSAMVWALTSKPSILAGGPNGGGGNTNHTLHGAGLVMSSTRIRSLFYEVTGATVRKNNAPIYTAFKEHIQNVMQGAHGLLPFEEIFPAEIGRTRLRSTSTRDDRKPAHISGNAPRWREALYLATCVDEKKMQERDGVSRAAVHRPEALLLLENAPIGALQPILANIQTPNYSSHRSKELWNAVLRRLVGSKDDVGTTALQCRQSLLGSQSITLTDAATLIRVKGDHWVDALHLLNANLGKQALKDAVGGCDDQLRLVTAKLGRVIAERTGSATILDRAEGSLLPQGSPNEDVPLFTTNQSPSAKIVGGVDAGTIPHMAPEVLEAAVGKGQITDAALQVWLTEMHGQLQAGSPTPSQSVAIMSRIMAVCRGLVVRSTRRPLRAEDTSVKACAARSRLYRDLLKVVPLVEGGTASASWEGSIAVLASYRKAEEGPVLAYLSGANPPPSSSNTHRVIQHRVYELAVAAAAACMFAYPLPDATTTAKRCTDAGDDAKSEAVRVCADWLASHPTTALLRTLQQEAILCSPRLLRRAAAPRSGGPTASGDVRNLFEAYERKVAVGMERGTPSSLTEVPKVRTWWASDFAKKATSGEQGPCWGVLRTRLATAYPPALSDADSELHLLAVASLANKALGTMMAATILTSLVKQLEGSEPVAGPGVVEPLATSVSMAAASKVCAEGFSELWPLGLEVWKHRIRLAEPMIQPHELHNLFSICSITSQPTANALPGTRDAIHVAKVYNDAIISGTSGSFAAALNSLYPPVTAASLTSDAPISLLQSTDPTSSLSTSCPEEYIPRVCASMAVGHCNWESAVAVLSPLLYIQRTTPGRRKHTQKMAEAYGIEDADNDGGLEGVSGFVSRPRDYPLINLSESNVVEFFKHFPQQWELGLRLFAAYPEWSNQGLLSASKSSSEALDAFLERNA